MRKQVVKEPPKKSTVLKADSASGGKETPPATESLALSLGGGGDKSKKATASDYGDFRQEKKMAKMKGKKKGPSGPLVLDMMEKSHDTVEGMEKSLQKMNQRQDSEEFAVTESIGLKAAPSPKKASKSAQTVTVGPVHNYLHKRKTFPLNYLQKGICDEVRPSNENILDFSGCTLVTDAVLSCMRDLPFNVRDSIIGVRLVGCHLVTDIGIIFLADAFHHIKKLFLSGCLRVTEASLAAVAEKCTSLETLDIVGTSVAVLPRKLADLTLVTDYAPIVSPLPSEMNNPPLPSLDMAKVCVIHREGETTMSVQQLLQGEKDLSITFPAKFKPNFPCGKDTMLNIVECNQSLVSLFTNGWGLYVIPSQVTDKTMIDNEAKAILGIISSVLFKSGGGSFVLLGMHTSATGIVPMDIVMEKVQNLMKDMQTKAMAKRPSNADPDTLAEQQEYDIVERRKFLMKGLNISALEVNVDDNAKATSKLKEHLTEQCAKNPELKQYCKGLADFMENFPEQGGKDLKTGIHTLNGATEFLLKGKAFKTQQEAQGAVLYLTKKGKLSCYEKLDGSKIYISTPLVCQIVSALLDSPPKTENQTQHISINDKTKLMKLEEFTERANKAKITLDLLSQVIKEVGVLGMLCRDGETFLPFSSLLPDPDFSLDRFAKTPNSIQATYMFTFPFPVPPNLWFRALPRLTSLRWPLHLWRGGMVIHHGVTEVLISCHGDRITLMGQTINSNMQGEQKHVIVLWETLEQYKLLLDQVFLSNRMTPQVSCEADQPKPNGVGCVVGGHITDLGADCCTVCGETPDVTNMLKLVDAEVNPRAVPEGNFRFELFGEMGKGGSLNGFNIVLQSGGKVTTDVGFGTRNQAMCSLLFNSGGYDQLSIQLSRYNQVETLMFGDKETICLTRKKADGTKEIVSPLPGVSLNITMTKTANSSCECIVDCCGEILAKQTLADDRYILTLSLEERYQQGQGTAPQLAADKVQFTIITQGSNAGLFQIKKGMRLEALDRLNPHLICVATVADIKPERKGKGGPILIHFDGWTNRYDYWAEEDSPDLHPIGYMDDNAKNAQLQAPNGYRKTFDWLTYLKEEKAEPVPFGFFTREQTLKTKSAKTHSVMAALGKFEGSAEDEDRPYCEKFSFRNTALEYKLKQEKAKALQVTDFLDVNPRLFCLLPSGLDLSFLRYPSMSVLFQPELQSLHMMCSGQENRFHLADYEGLKFTDVAKTYGSIEPYLEHMYLILMKMESLTIPLNIKHMCKGLKEDLPIEQQMRLEGGFQFLYSRYLIMFQFLHMISAPVIRTTKREKSTGMELNAQVSQELKKVLQNVTADQKQSRFSDCFVHNAEFTKLTCKPHSFAMSGDSGLTEFPPPLYDIGRTGTLVKLFLFRNNLESLPADFGEAFSSLQQLTLGSNKLTSMPSMAGLRCLTHLYLSKNKLKSLDFTDNLGHTLTLVDISDNPLGALPPSVSKLTNLKVLVADNIGTVNNLEPLLSLRGLTRLSLNYNVIPALPQNFHTCTATGLNLAAIPLVKSRLSVTEQVTMESLMKTYCQYTAVSVLPEKEQAALFLMLSEKPLEENLAAINARLLKRFPRLNGEVFPAEILKMETLEKIDLSNQSFVSVPDEIKNMKNLKELTLTGCYRLQTLSPEVSTLPLEGLALNECGSLKTPPHEIVARGFQAIRGYLRRLQMGSVDCKRTKLMMVGLGGAGKTSLVQALRNKRVTTGGDESITDGIDICEWHVPIKGETNPLQYSVWDFAGQSVYYNTHQFFLSDRAVYLLLWNIRLGYEHAGLDFWLSSIACHAPNAPVLVVGTHCDKVKRSYIPEVELKLRFKQIHSFHFVSSFSGEGLPKLKENLLAVTLTQNYMGEKIPEVWLNLEKQIHKERDQHKKALLPWKEMEEAGHRSGIFDNMELIQAVQFLHDLGSVQFFNTEFLRSNVVIVPQWIVDVMACVVTVHDGPIKNGQLKHEDLEEVWSAYPKTLHPWLLRLTEEFDLTFSLPGQQTNIVPCLLPNEEPEYTWNPVQRDSGEREMKMIYRFDYLPTGLFNRAQVRLQEFSEHSIMWKKGSLLKKNRHRALVLQTKSVELVVKAQGFKPENVLFLVHEVFECLVAESYSGVHYDYFIPCLECQATSQSEPCMFSRSKVQRAMEFKAPFLQCDSFHIMSIPEIQAVMPPDHDSDFDNHLRRSVNELNSLGEDTVISVFFCYSRKNVPSLDEDGKVVHPSTILQDLRAAGYKVSFTDDPENANMEAMTMSIKSAQVVAIGISDELLSDKQCHSLIPYARETLNKPILLIMLGKTSEWRKQDISLILGNEVYVNMQDIKRYESKIKELIAAVKTKAGHKTTEVFPDCFISYCWKNSKTAVSLGTSSTSQAIGWGDPREVKKYLQNNGVSCWLDVEQMGQQGFYEDLARGVRTSKVMVAFVSDEYAQSKNCRMEFQFAVESVRLPVLVAMTGTGYQWLKSEIGMLAVGHDCHQVNLQRENKEGLDEIVAFAKKVLEDTNALSSTPLSSAAQREIAFKEAMELTQRKFLRQLTMFMHVTGHEEYPHIIVIDILDKTKKDQGQLEDGGSKESEGDAVKADADPEKADEDGCAEESKEEQEKKEASSKAEEMAGGEETDAEVSDLFCFRALCEWEQGWHEVPGSVSFPAESTQTDSLLRQVAPYCVRLLAILKHTSIPLPILTLPQGEQICRNFEEWSSHTDSEFESAYKLVIDLVHQQDKDKTYCGLKRCHVTNGKQLWLCPKHSAEVGNVSEDNVPTVSSAIPVAPAFSDDEEEFTIHKEEEEQNVPSPTLAPRETTKTPRRSARQVNRATSRACLLM